MPMHLAADNTAIAVTDAPAREIGRQHEPLRLPGLTVEIVKDVAGLDALANEWRSLEALSSPDAVFQSFAHVRAWARHFTDERSALSLHTLVVRENRRAVLILPLAVSGPRFLRIARIAGDPVAQYAEVLVDPSADGRAALQAAFASLGESDIDAVVLSGLRDDATLYQLVAPYLSAATAREVAPFAELGGFAGYADFLKSRSKALRKALRRRGDQLKQAGPHAFEVLQGAEARIAVAEALDLKRKWMVQQGRMSSAFLDPATRECLLDLAENAGSGMIAARLTIGGETAAIRFGFEYRGTHFAYLSAYDVRFADLSPGKLLMGYCIAGFWDRGVTRLDMLPPDGPHKHDWCSEADGTADYALPLSLAGRIYAELFRAHIRPRLKRTFELMPTPVRSLLAALFVSI